MKTSFNIGILSDSPFITTGYSNQAKSLGNILVEEGHNVRYFAHTYVGQTIVPPVTFEDGRKLNFTIMGQGREAYFKDLLSTYVKEFKIDVLIILLDTFMLYPFLLELDLSPAKTIFWFPSDGGGGMPLGCENILRKVDVPIAMAKFGKEQCKKVHNLETRHIPHGIDISNYFPVSIEERNRLRQKWGVNDKFVIGVVARNQGRKMLDRTLKIMGEYAKLNPNAVLMLHCDPDDNAQVFPINSLINKYGIQNRVFFTGTKYYKGFDEKDMNEVYNVMDCFLLTTSGEGFGIPIIEAMACQVPVLATNYTTTKELVIDNNAGLGINLVGTTEEENPDVHGTEIIDGTITGSWAVERGICSIKDGVKKLDYLFNNPDKRKEMGINGRDAVMKFYDWNVLKEEWKKVIEELGGSY